MASARESETNGELRRRAGRALRALRDGRALRTSRRLDDVRRRLHVAPKRNVFACIVLLASLLTVVTSAGPARAVEQVVLKKSTKAKTLSGRVMAEAEDGGILLQTPDGVMWPLQPDEYANRVKDDTPFKPLTRDELASRIQAELPSGFKVHSTANYVICYNTSTAYAQWCGTLYERLFRGFRNYWENRGFDLKDPEFPLVALVFDRRESYLRYVREELGDSAESIVGFYSPVSNRVNMYDLTGIEGLKLPSERINSTALVNQILQQPAAAPTVATIVHEATHQLAYNCGLQRRLADNPVWVSEGLAVYFETPDLKNSKGWSNIGSVNRGRLLQFRKYQTQRPPNSLETLLKDDKRFRDASTALDAYAEAWALNYFLLRTHSKEYVSYLKQLAAKTPAVYDTPEERLTQFQAIFGGDLQKLDQEFVRYMRKVD